MYPHFIEVHCDGRNHLVNIEQIREVWSRYITLTETEMLSCDESYDQLQKLIRDSGCLINKGDPRLDTQHQLTLEDLKDMVGEPVWNSNLMRWHLVEKIEPDDYRGGVVELKGTNTCVWYYDSADLVKYPLYRLKV